MGCSSSKSAPVTEPKTLLTSDAQVPGKGEAIVLAVLQKYIMDANVASESEVKAALEGVPVVERRKLADALNRFAAPPSGDVAPTVVETSAHKDLTSYLDEAREASESEVQAALQGLSAASQKKLADALHSLLVADVPPSTVADADRTLFVEDGDVPAKGEVSLSPAGPQACDVPVVLSPRPALPELESNRPEGSAWLSCCTAPTEAAIESA